MNFLHRSKVDHRDIKPLNILIFINGKRVKLADFGAARDINSEFTLLTEGAGTLLYMAPESKNNNHVPYKSDMFSLGLILHKMMKKQLPDNYRNIKTGTF